MSLPGHRAWPSPRCPEHPRITPFPGPWLCHVAQRAPEEPSGTRGRGARRAGGSCFAVAARCTATLCCGRSGDAPGRALPPRPASPARPGPPGTSVGGGEPGSAAESPSSLEHLPEGGPVPRAATLHADVRGAFPVPASPSRCVRSLSAFPRLRGRESRSSGPRPFPAVGSPGCPPLHGLPSRPPAGPRDEPCGRQSRGWTPSRPRRERGLCPFVPPVSLEE